MRRLKHGSIGFWMEVGGMGTGFGRGPGLTLNDIVNLPQWVTDATR
jgi:hypothetical protein